MRNILATKLKTVMTAEQRYNVTREFLQHLLLCSLDRRGQFHKLAFVGGTALRVLYNLQRFSEDLDFSVTQAWQKGDSVSRLLGDLGKDLQEWGFDVESSPIKGDSVKNCFFKFPRLMEESRLGRDHRQKLSIKFEIDVNPPLGYHLETTAVQKDFLMVIHHHDLPSLFAGKLHAFLFRAYVKGRDIYDLLWYTTRGVKVNFTFLRNAAVQTRGASFKAWTADQMRQQVTQHVKLLDFKAAKADVAPFLNDPADLRLFSADILLKAVSGMQCE